MAKSGSKSYEPATTEKQIWELWEKGGYFHPRPDSRPKEQRFCVMIPLPNVTAALHLGHALNNTLQDILTRLNRMRGANTLWMLGTDHAGIATQATVEKFIFEKEKKTRHDLGREEMVRRIWEWKAKFGGRIIEQLKLMGCSGDYQRERFTLDEGCAKAVRHTFFKLFKDGLIYRGKRLVNWDTQLHTAVADDEVYHETVKGHFYHFKYPIIDPRPGEPIHVHIATTRPETMLGDTAVAVHPEPDRELDRTEAELRARLADASAKERPELEAALANIADRRRTHLPTLLKLRDMARAGRMVMLPLVNRPIPLICDEWARPDLGSGCVKITPAHDPNDYEVGQRHHLPMVNVMTEDGKIARIVEPDGSVNPNSSEYEGLRFSTKGREKVVADMQAAGLVEQIEDRLIEVGHSDRSKTPIEPFLSDQWFVKMGDLPPEQAAKIEGLRGASGLNQLAMDAVTSGRVRFFPERYARSYLDWLAEKRDWCISRQLWWGHRIPVWTLKEPIDDATEGAGRRSLEEMNHLTVEWFIPGCLREGDDPTREPLGTARRHGDLHCCLKDPPTAADCAILERLGFVEDPDVLDTWFSSALWPHSTLGWPDADPKDEQTDLGFWYPTNVLITAREIITLWVARMVMTGLYNVGDIPFSDVIIHSVIQDGQGRKMSKTLGNGVDPQDIIEEYGADALRFTLAEQATETQDIRLPVTPKKLPDGRTINVSERFEKGRNFCNKLWQASTGYVMSNLEGYCARPLAVADLRLEDRWILSRMTACLTDLNDALARYRFSEAMKVLYRFMWDEYCSWYIEMTKPRLMDPSRDRQGSGHDARGTAQQLLVYVLDQLLRMLHPFIPFVTEAIWQKLHESARHRGLDRVRESEPVLVMAAWPQANPALRDEQVEADMGVLQGIIRGIREIRTLVNDYRGRTRQPTLRTLPEAVVRAQAAVCALVETYRGFVTLLAGCDDLRVGVDLEKPKGAMSRIDGGVQVYVSVADLVDLAEVRKAEEAKLAELRGAWQRAERQLANEDFTRRADPAVVAQARERAGDLADQIRLVEQHLRDLA